MLALGKGERRGVLLGSAFGRAGEATMVTKLVPEGGVPDLAEGALVGRHEDAAPLPEPDPVARTP